MYKIQHMTTTIPLKNTVYYVDKKNYCGVVTRR